jgi:hypothetical protein
VAEQSWSCRLCELGGAYPGNGPETGCSILFIYYLFHQLGFTIPQIIAAAPGYTNGVLNAIAPLRGVYQNLTGDRGDPFPRFAQLLAKAFPPEFVSSIPGPAFDDPWPLAGAPAHTITGVVTDSSGGPVVHASIILKAGFIILPGSGNTLQLSTDSEGQYATPLIPFGIYEVNAEQGGFERGRATVILLGVASHPELRSRPLVADYDHRAKGEPETAPPVERDRHKGALQGQARRRARGPRCLWDHHQKQVFGTEFLARNNKSCARA